MLVVFALALLLSMPMPKRVVALASYWFAVGSLQSYKVKSLWISIAPTMRLSIAQTSL